ncbi:MAG TPA: hypothetical protein VGG06_17505 [Thermoanaerobaculia bacterium]|jgi:hypothetical protein
MSGLARRGLAAVLLLALVPGVSEIVENVVHLAVEGHAAHARPSGDQHSEPGPEHGCNGTFHLCSCHHSLSFLPAVAPPAVRRAAPDGSPATPETTSPRAGFHHIPEKPPRA